MLGELDAAQTQLVAGRCNRPQTSLELERAATSFCIFPQQFGGS